MLNSHIVLLLFPDEALILLFFTVTSARRKNTQEGTAYSPSCFSPLRCAPTLAHFSFIHMCVCALTIASYSFWRMLYKSVRCFPVAVLQHPTYLPEELSASPLPMSQPLSLIRDSETKPIQLMCSHNVPQIHPALHPFTSSPEP